MKRICAGLLSLLFVVGVLIVPTVHRMHCDGWHTAHAVDQCPICQVALAPVIVSASHVAPIAKSIIIVNVSPAQVFTPSSRLCRAAQARAPPIA